MFPEVRVAIREHDDLDGRSSPPQKVCSATRLCGINVLSNEPPTAVEGQVSLWNRYPSGE